MDGGIGARGAARRVGEPGVGGEGERRGDDGGLYGGGDRGRRNRIGFSLDFSGGGRALKYMLRFRRDRLACGTYLFA